MHRLLEAVRIAWWSWRTLCHKKTGPRRKHEREVGKGLTLNGERATVIGIMPPDFKEAGVELWINPKQVVPDFSTTSRDDVLALRTNNYLRVIGRLKPGVTIAQAQGDISSIVARLQRQYPQTNAVRSVRLVSLHERVVGDLRQTMLVLFGAVGLVLLIASANVANLMIVRATARGKEIAIRLALGAGRWRIMRQLLAESVLLACMGGACGWLLAVWGVDLMLALSPAGTPRLPEVRLDHRVFGFTLFLSLATGVVFGLFTALAASRTDLNQTLKEGGRSAASDGRGHRLRGALVIAEVALALVVLIGAGLLIKSFARLQNVAPGFDPNGLTTMLIWLSDARYLEATRRVAFLRELRARLSVLPGVQSVAIANDLPIRGNDSSNFPIIEGRPVPAPNERILTGIHVVSPGYFQAMGIPLRKGRELTERDNENAPLVMVINETAARSLWPGEFALTLFGLFAGVALLLTVIGIYGVLAYTVAERTREIGIRIALGAQTNNVLRLMIGQGMKLALGGVSVGLIGAFAMTRLMKDLLFSVSATDPATFAGVALFLIGVALLACYLPARKATKIDPITALRHE
jgi:putative ABC transport system permease protein